MIKDDPAFPNHLQPTRENIVSALNFFIVFLFIVLPWPDLYGTDFGLWTGFSCVN
jgi:hypothetical protein